jgi:multiple sugar transport system permease protein
VFRRVIRAFAPPAEGSGKPRGWEFGKYRWAYAILLPAVLSILAWQYVPLVRGSVMAFMDYQLMKPSVFVWLDNFANELWSADWWGSVGNSVRYSLLVISCTFLPPVILAVLLQEVPRGKILFRTIYYLPAIITGIVTILLWKSFYEPSEHGALNALLLRVPAVLYLGVGGGLLMLCLAFARRLFLHRIRLPGVLCVLVGLLLLYTCAALTRPILLPGNSKPLWQILATLDFRSELAAGSRVLAPTPPGVLLRRLGGFLPEPYGWLNDPDTAMFCLVLPMIWAGMGPGCLIYLAALKGIAEEYYEAADVDGATFIDKILFVVFPMLKALLIINFVGIFIGSWAAEANVLAMTGGAANTKVAGLHIFYTAYTDLRFGPATALAWFLGFMLIGFTVHQLRVLSRIEFRAEGAKGG